ncbi:unnamed protein product, partial [marine sediment metagenome]
QAHFQYAKRTNRWLLTTDRLKYPMKKENGGWKRISWDEALDIIATELQQVKDKFQVKHNSLPTLPLYPPPLQGRGK